MLPAPKPSFPSYVPRAPEKPIKGRVIAAYGWDVLDGPLPR